MSIKFTAKLAVCLVSASLVCSVYAQQPTESATPASSQQSDNATKPVQPETAQQPSDPNKPDPAAQGSTSGTSKDRLFYTLPNFLTLENSGKVPPLTTKQKFAVVTRGSFDYVQMPWYGFLTGISQWEDSEPGYGQGAAGFGKRFGAAFADGTIENYLTGAIFPSLLREDPRYFQSGHGSFGHRTLYAMSRNLITRTDAGTNRFNFSEVVGGALSAAISTYAYHPKSHLFPTTTPGRHRFVPSDRTLDNTAKVWATQYGYDTMTLVVKEFWPDIRRKLKHKSKETMLPEAGKTP